MINIEEPTLLAQLMKGHGDNSLDFKLIVLKLVSELKSSPKVSR